MIRMTFKTFACLMVLAITCVIVGNIPDKPSEGYHFPKPKAGEWCLGYDYHKQEYRYHTDYDPNTTPKQVYFGTGRGTVKDSPHIRDRGNFTREQLRDLQEYVDILKAHSGNIDEMDIDIDFYLD